MEQISREEFAKMMAAMGNAFGVEVVKEKLAIYYAYLKHIPFAALRTAVDRIIKTRKFMSLPSIAEIRELAAGVAESDLEDRARTAWEQAKSELIAGPNDADPVLSLTVKIAFGGWDGFGATDPDNEASDRKHFLSCYKLAAREIVESRLLPGDLKKELEDTRRRIAELRQEAENRALPAPETR